MPTPLSGETEREYVNRFMANKRYRGEYKSHEQAAAVAHSKYRKAKGTESVFSIASRCPALMEAVKTSDFSDTKSARRKRVLAAGAIGAATGGVAGGGFRAGFETARAQRINDALRKAEDVAKTGNRVRVRPSKIRIAKSGVLGAALGTVGLGALALAGRKRKKKRKTRESIQELERIQRGKKAAKAGAVGAGLGALAGGFHAAGKGAPPAEALALKHAIATDAQLAHQAATNPGRAAGKAASDRAIHGRDVLKPLKKAQSGRVLRGAGRGAIAGGLGLALLGALASKEVGQRRPRISVRS